MATLTEQGDAIFNKAYQASQGSLSGTAAALTSQVANLVPAQAASLASDVKNAAEDGAAIGSVISDVVGLGPLGGIIGGAIGAVIGIFTDLFSTQPPPPPEGEFRSLAERMEFPAVPNIVPAPDGSPSSLMAMQVAQPASYLGNRARNVTIEVPFFGDDQLSGTRILTRFNFGVGWVPPQRSSPIAHAAAWAVAQAFIGRGIVSSAARQKVSPAQAQALLERTNGYYQTAWTILGSEAAVKLALDVMQDLYGANFSPKFNPSALGTVDNDGFTDQYGNPGAFAAIATAVNKGWPLDYTTYVSERFASITGADRVVDVGTLQNIPQIEARSTQVQMVALPDTTVVGIAELSICVALGLIPREGASLVALHFVSAHAWGWRRGQETDPATQGAPVLFNHPNFSRLIGHLTNRVREERAGKMGYAGSFPGKLSAAGTRNNLQGQGNSGILVLGAIGAIGLVYLSTRKR